MTTFLTFFSHTILQKSWMVCLLGPETELTYYSFSQGTTGEGDNIMVSVSVKMSRFEPSTIRLFQKGGNLSACYQLVPISVGDWFTKGSSTCYHVYVIMHVKDP